MNSQQRQLIEDKQRELETALEEWGKTKLGLAHSMRIQVKIIIKPPVGKHNRPHKVTRDFAQSDWELVMSVPWHPAEGALLEFFREHSNLISFYEAQAELVRSKRTESIWNRVERIRSTFIKMGWNYRILKASGAHQHYTLQLVRVEEWKASPRKSD